MVIGFSGNKVKKNRDALVVLYIGTELNIIGLVEVIRCVKNTLKRNICGNIFK